MNALQEQELIDLALEQEDDEGFPMDESELKERWKVTNLESANWCLRKMAALEAKRNEINRLAEQEIKRIQEWQNRQTESLNRDHQFFSKLLEEYHRAELKKNPRAKTISTPYGKLQLRAQQPLWEYDEDKLLKFLNDTNRKELIRLKITESPDKTAIKEKCIVVDGQVIDMMTGEIIQGISVFDRPESFSVKVEVE
jgi:phage host-nuclease inhibitor protein Gam